MSAYELARPEIRDLVPYDTPDVPEDFTRLNANEAAVSPYKTNLAGESKRYPDVRPRLLRSVLATLCKVDEDTLCPTRGSSEAIDLLIRTFCRAYRDNVVILPPTFEMYETYANMQAAEVRYAPLDHDQNFSVNWEAVAAQCDDRTRIVFLCSPNSPTGTLIPYDEILSFARERSGKSIVVVDEAYVEYCSQSSLVAKVEEYDNLVILRTLSKAYALAGARCGALVGCSDIVRLTSALMSPYAISVPVTRLVLEALQGENLISAGKQIRQVAQERNRLQSLLRDSSAIEQVWQSDANFILVRLRDPEAVRRSLTKHRILIREFGDTACLQNCARITVGTPAESEKLMIALKTAGEITQ